MRNRIIKKDITILYPELSYQIIGILFEVSNILGSGYHERYYQKTIADFFSKAGIEFQEQVPVKLIVDNRPVAKGYIDFLIEDKIILEIKKGERFLKHNIEQLHSYLKITNKKLGILANFTMRGLQFKRIVNLHS